MTQTPGPEQGPPQSPSTSSSPGPAGAAPGGQYGPRADRSGLDRFFDWLRSLDVRRSSERKWLAGVCSGVAWRLGVDTLVVRAALVLLTLLGGLGITLYLIAWAFLPNDRDEILAERGVRHGEVGPIVLLVVIVLSLLGGGGFAHDGPGLVWFWWLAVPAGVVLWLVTRNRHSSTSTAFPPFAYAAPAGGTTAAGASAPVGATAPAGASTYAPGAPPPAQPYPQPYPSGQAGGYAGPPPAPPAPVTSRPPRAPRPPRREGAGFLGAVLVTGLALAAYGLALWGHDHFGWHGSGGVVALGAALGVTGLAVAAFGFAGRRAGLAGFIAILLALVTWTGSVVPRVNVDGGIGDRLWRPSATQSTDRYRLGIGAAELDLSGLPAATGSVRHLDASIGVGELRIRVPAGLTVRVDSSIGAGDVGSWVPSGPASSGGSSDALSTTKGPSGRNLATSQTLGSGAPDVIVTAHVGLGQILIGKE